MWQMFRIRSRTHGDCVLCTAWWRLLMRVMLCFFINVRSNNFKIAYTLYEPPPPPPPMGACRGGQNRRSLSPIKNIPMWPFSSWWWAFSPDGSLFSPLGGPYVEFALLAISYCGHPCPAPQWIRAWLFYPFNNCITDTSLHNIRWYDWSKNQVCIWQQCNIL